MGSWKLLFPLRNTTIIGSVVSTALEACSRVILVAGWRGRELARLFEGEARVRVVENPDWALGMFSSIRRGVAVSTTPRFFIALGDMPFVEPAVYHALLRAADAPSTPDWPLADFVFPVHGSRRGHPVLVDGRLREVILRSDPATGSMREIASRSRVSEVPWHDDAILRDIDTPEDYERAQRGAIA